MDERRIAKVAVHSGMVGETIRVSSIGKQSTDSVLASGDELCMSLVRSFLKVGRVEDWAAFDLSDVPHDRNEKA